MKKHAFLITAYDNLYVLETLIKMLDRKENDLYIHLDKKMGDMSEWQSDIQNRSVSKITFIPRRDIKWGEYKYTETILDLLSEAVKNSGKGGYWYYHLLTGTSLPIKSQQYIHEFFDKDDMNLLFFHINKDTAKVIQDRCKAYYPFISSKYFRKHKLLKGISLIAGKLQMVLGVNRLRHSPMNPVYNGWGWFSIPHDFAEYAVSQKELIKKTFKYTLAPDETWIQTVAIHSDFKDRVYGFNGRDDAVDASKHLQDWERGKPYVFRKEDFDFIMENETAFWARKFDQNVDRDIIDMIYEKVSGESREKV